MIKWKLNDMEMKFSILTKKMTLFSGVDDDQLIKLISYFTNPLPIDFIAFLKFSNGAVGTIGDNYLEICNAKDLISLNKEYHVELLAPLLVLFGTDGGGEGYGFDYRGKEPIVVDIPFIGTDWKLARRKGDNFIDFLQKLSGSLAK